MAMGLDPYNVDNDMFLCSSLTAGKTDPRKGLTKPLFKHLHTSTLASIATLTSTYST